jgi:hypothetical protein
MGLVQQFCHRAMMLSDGEVKMIGDPGEVGRAYLSENFRSTDADLSPHGAVDAEQVRLLDVWMTDVQGHRTDSVGYGEPMRLSMLIEARAPIHEPGIAMWLTTEERVRVFSVGAREDGAALADLQRGERVEFSIEAENPLSAGRYYVGAAVVRGSAGLDVLVYQERAADIVSYGADLVGLIGIEHAVSVVRSRAGEPVR